MWKFRRLRRDVYARPTPSISVEEWTDLNGILPPSVADANRYLEEGATRADRISIEAFYYAIHFEGEIAVGIAKFPSADAAASFLDESISEANSKTGSTGYSQGGKVHWLAHTESGESLFAWRKGAWAFTVWAPDKALRDRVLEELPF